MTTMTLAPATLGGHDPDYYAGRADAYDEHRAGTSIAELRIRAEYIADLHPSAAYGAGYSAYVTSARMEHAAIDAAVLAIESDLAHTDPTRSTR